MFFESNILFYNHAGDDSMIVPPSTENTAASNENSNNAGKMDVFYCSHFSVSLTKEGEEAAINELELAKGQNLDKAQRKKLFENTRVYQRKVAERGMSLTDQFRLLQWLDDVSYGITSYRVSRPGIQN